MFVEDLRRAAKAPATSTRTATTCLLNALRCGVTVEELQSTLPGAPLADMAASYDELDRFLNRAAAAWARIVDRPTSVVLLEEAATAESVLPVPVHRVASALMHVTTSSQIAVAVDRIQARVENVAAAAAAAERGLARLSAGDPRGLQLGRSLHDVSAPGLWNDEYFLATRVGALSATRAADLRGDSRA